MNIIIDRMSVLEQIYWSDCREISSKNPDCKISFSSIVFNNRKKIIVLTDNCGTRIGLALLLFIQLCRGVIFFMEDYFIKYWLYNKKTGKFDF